MHLINPLVVRRVNFLESALRRRRRGVSSERSNRLNRTAGHCVCSRCRFVVGDGADDQTGRVERQTGQARAGRNRRIEKLDADDKPGD